MIEVPDILVTTENDLARHSSLTVDELRLLMTGERRINTRKYFGQERRKA